MAVLFRHSDGSLWGSVPSLPLVSRSWVYCVSKTAGFIPGSERYRWQIGRVVFVALPGTKEHGVLSWADDDGFVKPRPDEPVVMASFGPHGDDVFALWDVVHVVRIHTN